MSNTSVFNSGWPLARQVRFPVLSSHPFEVQSRWGRADLLEEIADEWLQLCQSGPCYEPFFRPEWIAAAVRAFAGDERLLLVTVRSRGQLRAVLPLVERKMRTAGLLHARLCSASLIPRFEFMHGEGADLADAVHAAWQHLHDLPGWDVIELANIPEGGAAERLFALAQRDAVPTARHDYARTPYASLHEHKPGSDFSRFGRSSRFRGQLRQGWRELSKRGSLHLRRTERADAEVLQRFYELEQSGWKGREGTAILSRTELRNFYDAIVRSAEQFGYLSMYFLEVGDTTVAAHLGLTYAGRYYPIKVAYNEEFSDYRPGHLIIGRVIEDCIARGIAEVDFLGDWTEAKAKWTSDVRRHTVCSIFRNTAVGRLLWAQLHLRQRMQHAVRTVRRSVINAATAYKARQQSRGPQTSSQNKSASSD